MSDLHARRLLVFLVLAAVALTVVLLEPFWVALFLAAVVSAALRPAMEWLSGRLGGRRGIAAGLVTLGLVVVVLLPLAALGALLVNQIVQGIDWFRTTLQSEGVWGVVQRLPGPIEHAVRELLRAIPHSQKQLQQLAGEQSGQAAAAVGGVLAATGTALFQTAMMLVALFFFLTDGERLVAWIDERVPLRRGTFRALLEDFRQTSVSVLRATVGTAGIQTLAALVGYLVSRAPNPLFLTLTTFVVALIPAVGGTIVVVLVGVLLLATGHVLAGIFLCVWGVAIVGIADNFARPWLLKGGMELHGGIVFFALLGGLAVFGGIGLLLGPLIVTFLVAVTRLYAREFGAPDA